MSAPHTDTQISPPRRALWHDGSLALAACGVTTLIATPLREILDQANIIMLFLLTVLLVAVRLGRQAAIIASLASVLLFDVFFVPPRFSLSVDNVQYLITFAVMLAVSLITTELTTGLKRQAEEARRRGTQDRALYDLARQLADVMEEAEARKRVQAFARKHVSAELLFLSAAGHGDTASVAPFHVETPLAKMALLSGKTIYGSVLSEPGFATFYVPMPGDPDGILACMLPADRRDPPAPDEVALIEALASLVAGARARIVAMRTAQHNEIEAATERLRASILSALSHDLRTPLTVLAGLADTLSIAPVAAAPAPTWVQETAAEIRTQTQRLIDLMSKLLDMARLYAGSIRLHREWQPLEEVVGSSLQLLGSALAQHKVDVVLPPDLPLLRFDAVLMERVLCNLLENAAKYAPTGSTIVLSAEESDEDVIIRVRDAGPGFALKGKEDVFALFVRAEPPVYASATPGVGMGLAICRAIVQAHGGTIAIETSEKPGGCVRFTLPKGVPPLLEDEAPLADEVTR